MDNYPKLPENFNPKSPLVVNELLPVYLYNRDRYIQCKDLFQKDEHLRVLRITHDRMLIEERKWKENEEKMKILYERQNLETKIKEEQLKKEWEIKAKEQTREIIQGIIDDYAEQMADIKSDDKEITRIGKLSGEEITYDNVMKSGKGSASGMTWEKLYSMSPESKKYYIVFWVKHQREIQQTKRILRKQEYESVLAPFRDEKIEIFGPSLLKEMLHSSPPSYDKYRNHDIADAVEIDNTIEILDANWLESSKVHKVITFRCDEYDLFYRKGNRPVIVYVPKWKKLKVWGDDELEGRILMVKGSEFTPLKKHKGYFKGYKVEDKSNA